MFHPLLLIGTEPMTSSCEITQAAVSFISCQLLKHSHLGTDSHHLFLLSVLIYFFFLVVKIFPSTMFGIIWMLLTCHHHSSYSSYVPMCVFIVGLARTVNLLAICNTCIGQRKSLTLIITAKQRGVRDACKKSCGRINISNLIKQ